MGGFVVMYPWEITGQEGAGEDASEPYNFLGMAAGVGWRSTQVGLYLGRAIATDECGRTRAGLHTHSIPKHILHAPGMDNYVSNPVWTTTMGRTGSRPSTGQPNTSHHDNVEISALDSAILSMVIVRLSGIGSQIYHPETTILVTS